MELSTHSKDYINAKSLYKLKMFDFTHCEFFCIENFAYKNHLYGHPFPNPIKYHAMLIASPPLEESYCVVLMLYSSYKAFM